MANKTNFKKGNIPWNKGKQEIYSTEYRKKLSIAQKKRFQENPISEKRREKMREINKGEKAYNWKGNRVGYKCLHSWVYCWKGKPQICEICGATKKQKKLHWANKSHKYLRDLSDWISLCVSCHKKYDNVKNL